MLRHHPPETYEEAEALAQSLVLRFGLDNALYAVAQILFLFGWTMSAGAVHALEDFRDRHDGRM